MNGVCNNVPVVRLLVVVEGPDTATAAVDGGIGRIVDVVAMMIIILFW